MSLLRKVINLQGLFWMQVGGLEAQTIIIVKLGLLTFETTIPISDEMVHSLAQLRDFWLKSIDTALGIILYFKLMSNLKYLRRC